MPYSGHNVCEPVRHLIFRQWHGVCGDAIAFKEGHQRAGQPVATVFLRGLSQHEFCNLGRERSILVSHLIADRVIAR